MKDQTRRKVSVTKAGEGQQHPTPTADISPGTQDLSALYVSDEIHERTICGIKFKLKELAGDDHLDLTERFRKGEKLDMSPYTKELLKRSIVEPNPESIDFNKLKAEALTSLVSAINDINGLSEMVQKKLESGLKEGSSTTQ